MTRLQRLLDIFRMAFQPTPAPAPPTLPRPHTYDLVTHLTRQRTLSIRAFGPLTLRGRPAGVVDHIRRECLEIEQSHYRDTEEWIDVALLAFDGALRTGCSPELVAQVFHAKLLRNEHRRWPDWRTADATVAAHHLTLPAGYTGGGSTAAMLCASQPTSPMDGDAEVEDGS